jgi:hypothetical protein
MAPGDDLIGIEIGAGHVLPEWIDFQRMYHAKYGYLAATAEWMSLHVDMKTRRVAPWPDKILDNSRVMRVGKPLFSAPSDNV